MSSVLNSLTEEQQLIYQSAVLSLIKSALFGIAPSIPRDIDSDVLYTILNEQAIFALVSDQFDSILPTSEIKSYWKNRLYQIWAYNVNVQHVESDLIDLLHQNQIDVAVIKGSAAAYYYPNSNNRTRGDIDIIVPPDQFDRATDLLVENEFVIDLRYNYYKHKNFSKCAVNIELHRYFFNNDDEDEQSTVPILINPNNDLIFNAILRARSVIINNYCTRILPDIENGLVLLQHIKQHIKKGLGLRQIIDWMMFVKTILDDETWFSCFREKAQILGLEDLAIITTKMCQRSLGLTTEGITWCDGADDDVCDSLLYYLFECGNFGRNRGRFQSGSAIEILSIKHPLRLFKYIQDHGEKNWKAIEKHNWLRPFAWIYQSCSYVKLAVRNRVGIKKLISIYDEGEKRNEIFSALGL